MSGSFFDTNVIVYAHDASDRTKQAQARAVMHTAMVARQFVVSSQVMQEFYAVALRKQWMTSQQAAAVLRLLAGYSVVPASAESVLRALALQQRHGLSVWDASIVQAALDARCTALYSEDLQAGMRFEPEGRTGAVLTVLNPFEPPAVHEAEPAARAKRQPGLKRARA